MALAGAFIPAHTHIPIIEEDADLDDPVLGCEAHDDETHCGSTKEEREGESFKKGTCTSLM